MNKNTRKALTQSLSLDLDNATTADHYVQIATHMADSTGQGRTDRWKDACRNAGEMILDVTRRGDRSAASMERAVRQGLSKMVEANK